MMRPGTTQIALAVVACLTVCSVEVGAQDSASVAAGARLRIRTDSTLPWHYGRFAGIAGDSLLLAVRHAPSVERFQLSSLDEIDVRERDPRMHRSNAILGLILGGATGVLVLHLGVRECDVKNRHSDGPACGIAYVNAPFFAFAGAGIGAMVGHAWPANRWRPVTIVRRTTQ